MQAQIERNHAPPIHIVRTLHDFIVSPSTSNLIKLYDVSLEPSYAQYFAQFKSNYQDINIQTDRILDVMLEINFMLATNKESGGLTTANINELLDQLATHLLDNSNPYAFLLWHLAGKILMAIDYIHIAPSQIEVPANLIHNMPDIFFSMQFYQNDHLKRLCFQAATEYCFRKALEKNTNNLETYLLLAEFILNNYAYMIQEKFNQSNIAYSTLSVNYLDELRKTALNTFINPPHRRAIFNTFDNIALQLTYWIPVVIHNPRDRFLGELDFYKSEKLGVFSKDHQILENALKSCGYKFIDLPHIIPSLMDLKKITQRFEHSYVPQFINELITDYGHINDEQTTESPHHYMKSTIFPPYNTELINKWLKKTEDLHFFLGLLDNSCSNFNRHKLFLRLRNTIDPYIKKMFNEATNIEPFAKSTNNKEYTSNSLEIQAPLATYQNIGLTLFSPSDDLWPSTNVENPSPDNVSMLSETTHKRKQNLMQFSIFDSLPEIDTNDDIWMSFEI